MEVRAEDGAVLHHKRIILIRVPLSGA